MDKHRNNMVDKSQISGVLRFLMIFLSRSSGIPAILESKIEVVAQDEAKMIDLRICSRSLWNVMVDAKYQAE